jgi:hypothetical protein
MVTLNTRNPLLTLSVAVLLAWAGVGIATGHVYLIPGRGLVHFGGLSAFFASSSVLLAALALVFWSRRILAFSLVPLVLAIGTKAAEAWWGPLLPGLGSPLSDDSLRQILAQPRAAALARSVQPVINSWLLASCFGLVAVALLLRLLGATKESARNHPVATSLAALVFGLPFLAWFSTELLSYLLSPPPALSGRGLAAEAALFVSMLIVVLASWCVAMLLTVALVVRALGGKVQWSAE